MKIVISEEAMNWFKEEMETKSGEYIHFYARYGGSSQLHDAFSLGVTKEQPLDLSVEQIEDRIHFYIEERDLWYFDGHDLHVNVDTKINELTYSYQK
ncbi:HesB/YadR/YfhF family protein [Paenisporosarcina sp. TG20]|uniref:HesB/YadR/YfhF family protein n=1 Tax=Paenisporosarcina sp. TG20 TaxID=1211706 RepID=UPI0002E64BD6|nr:HesB/YadR/YfhF family protein [Paenisporosarcina sp. TG20]